MWFVCILRASDGSLYTGITTDLVRRIGAHNAGKNRSSAHPLDRGGRGMVQL